MSAALLGLPIAVPALALGGIYMVSKLGTKKNINIVIMTVIVDIDLDVLVPLLLLVEAPVEHTKLLELLKEA